ncbi:MAG: metal ABC transporter permease [Erysipelotrichaceae bacterium]
MEEEVQKMTELFNDYTFQVVALGGIALGILCGVTGVFAVLRKQSLIGDSIAHSSLAGIAVAFILTQSKNTEVLLLGALVVGLITTFIIDFFSNNTRINFESAMALVMSSFFGFGLMLLTEIQKFPNANQAGLNRFLFGQAATILLQDVVLIVVVTLLVLILIIIFWKEIKLFIFDETFSCTSGFSCRFINLLLNAFIVASVIVGIQMVGVVLMSALIIAPAVAARQWSSSLLSMVLLAIIIGAISGFTGTVISSSISGFPTGPAIVLIVSTFVFVSILLAPKRGIVHKHIQKKYAIKCFEAEMLLIHYFSHHDKDVKARFDKTDFYINTIDNHKITDKHFNKLLNNLSKRKLLVINDQELTLCAAGLELLIQQGVEL